jgi:hypothetical protein
LRTQEDQSDIALCKRQGLSYREIARRGGCSPRTAKKHSEHPELIGKARKPVHRPSKLDIFWLKDESLEDSANLPAPGILAAEIMEDLQAALDQFSLIAEDLGGEE